MATDNSTKELRKQLIDAMRGHQAHLDFSSALKDFPPQLRGVKPSGAPHTAWQLLEHLRIAQHDILEFSHHSDHRSPKWPDEYWPKEEAPADEQAWINSVNSFQNDAKAMDQLVENTQSDLFKPFTHGQGQTLLREALLVASHNSYHLGQLLYLKKMLLNGK